jgi:hypothetical protein
MTIISDNSKEPEEEIKQGAGDLRACGPSTFKNVDPFYKNVEIFPFTRLSCAAVNANKNADI